MSAYLPLLADATYAAILGCLALAAMFGVLTLRSWLADRRARRPADAAPARKKRRAAFGLPDPKGR